MLPIPFFNPFLAPEALHKIGAVVGSELFVLCVCVCLVFGGWCTLHSCGCVNERREESEKN